LRGKIVSGFLPEHCRMTLHLSPPPPPAQVDAFAVWRARYPKFAAALDGGESPVKALRYLGLALWQDGDLAAAADVLTAAAKLAPAEPTILGELGSLLCLAGRKVEALQYLSASLQRDPRQTQVWLTVAGLCNEIGDKTTAEQAFRAALDLDPYSAEAAAGLGLLYLETHRFEDAVRLLTEALERGATAFAIHACLGQALYQLGDFPAARAALAEAAEAYPDQAGVVRKYALALLIDALLSSPVEEAIAAYRAAAGPHAEDVMAVCRAAFQALCGYGHEEAAIRLGDELLKRAPGDPVVSYHLDALRGRALDRAPSAYVAACFDKYAPDFDRHLVGVLDYRIPEKLQPLLAATGRVFPRILDLGCGTGLAASMLASFGGAPTGVDLSPRMLEKAKERGVYAELVEAEAVAFLSQAGEPFDLVVALDMLGYLGDLAPLFAGVAERLAPGGLFAFSFESGAGEDYRLSPAGRFAHDPAYVERLSAERFEGLVSSPTMIRLEANRPVAGRLALLRLR
jgi:predicted TPR repeat methyltransferase/Flp pilus assembly protein TadD